MSKKQYCPKGCGETMKRDGHAAHNNKQRWTCKVCKHKTVDPRHVPDFDEQFKRPLPKAKGYIITAAQNATPVWKPFWRNLQAYADWLGFKLIVIPYRYKNPNSRWSKNDKDNDWYATAIHDHAYSQRDDINDNLMFLGDIKIIPSMTQPLNGLEAISGSASAIIGHPQITLRAVPTPNNKLPKLLMTTGACTLMNYTDSKQGKQGEFHHSFGALIVEVRSDKEFHARQLNAIRDASFMDLDRQVKGGAVTEGHTIEALVMGDTHVDFVDPNVVKATFTDPKSIVKVLKPKTLVWHDLLDFYSQSKHQRNDPFVQIAKRQVKMNGVMNEIKRACEFVDTMTPKGVRNVLVPSNHPEFMKEWIVETDWRRDAENAEMYLETALAMVRSTHMQEHGSYTIEPFLYWAQKLMSCKKQTRFLDRDESCMIKGIEVGMHGDKGPNGVRGSVMNLSRIGTKSIIGHSHTPGIRLGCYQVGTSSRLRLEYNRGPSSWLHTHCLVYSNGKRALVNIINGRWKA